MFGKKCMDEKEYYLILNIDIDSTSEQIKKAYRQQAIIYHPDKNNGNDNQFKKIQEAYEVLSNSDKKHLYDNNIIDDQFNCSEDMMRNGHNATFFTSDPTEIIFHFEDLFSNMMFNKEPEISKDNTFTPPITNKPETIFLTLDDIIYGCEKKITYTRDLLCSKCNGEGATFSSMIQCITCQGRGYCDSFPFPTVCRSCNGNSKIKTNVKKCILCKGNKKIKNDFICEMNILPGQEHNSKLFIKEHHLNITIKHDLSKSSISMKDNTLFVKHCIKLEEMLCGFTHYITLGKNDKHIKLEKDGYFNVKEPIVFLNNGVLLKDGSRGSVIIKCFIEGTSKEKELKKFLPAFKKIFR